MPYTVTVKLQAPVHYLSAHCGVRYWEDGKVNGEVDTDGAIPCRVGSNWCPLIHLETGVIAGWPKGVTADLHYKVCDSGEYFLIGNDATVVAHKEGYVPSMMCPEENGYGDYVIMKIDGAGRIEGWKADLSYFEYDFDD